MNGKVELKSNGSRHHLYVNGQEIRARGAAFKVIAGEASTVVIDLRLVEVEAEDGEVEIIIPQHTREALLSLGWKEPDE